MVLLSGLCSYSFRFGSALNPDSSIRMNCRYGPWIFSSDGLCFVEYTIPVMDKYSITNFVIVVNTCAVFTFVTVICLVLPIFSNLIPVSYERTKIISHPNIAAPGEAFNTVWYV